MTKEELKILIYSKHINTHGVACFISLPKAIGTISTDNAINILPDDTGVNVDIPKWCSKQISITLVLWKQVISSLFTLSNT